MPRVVIGTPSMVSARLPGDPKPPAGEPLRPCASTPRAQGGLELIEVLTPVIAAYRVDRALGVEGCHPIERELGDAPIRLLGDLQGELCRSPRLDRVDQPAGRVVEPVALGFIVRRDPWFPAVRLVGADSVPGVPVAQAKHTH